MQGEEKIQIHTQDHKYNVLNINKFDKLKINTEGVEINVLKGAAQMLQFETIISLVFTKWIIMIGKEETGWVMHYKFIHLFFSSKRR